MTSAVPMYNEFLRYSFIETWITPPKMLLQQRLRLILNRSCGILKKSKIPLCLNTHAEIQFRENIWWLTIKVYFIKFDLYSSQIWFIYFSNLLEDILRRIGSWWRTEIRLRIFTFKFTFSKRCYYANTPCKYILPIL